MKTEKEVEYLDAKILPNMSNNGQKPHTDAEKRCGLEHLISHVKKYNSINMHILHSFLELTQIKSHLLYVNCKARKAKKDQIYQPIYAS